MTDSSSESHAGDWLFPLDRANRVDVERWPVRWIHVNEDEPLGPAGVIKLLAACPEWAPYTFWHGASFVRDGEEYLVTMVEAVPKGELTEEKEEHLTSLGFRKLPMDWIKEQESDMVANGGFKLPKDTPEKPESN